MVLDEEFGGMNEGLYNLPAIVDAERYAAVGGRFTKTAVFQSAGIAPRPAARAAREYTHSAGNYEQHGFAANLALKSYCKALRPMVS